MTKKTMQLRERRHPFGELLTRYRARKPGLTQTRLAELAGYDPSILVRMGQGKKDLTGPSGRERIVRLVETLAEQGVLTTLDEANALLSAASLSPLFEKQPIEAQLIVRLTRTTAVHHVRRTNLPASLTGFIGRTEEIAQVRRLLGETRLVTLTGTGGCGKTRLAQRVAADMLITYADGVWYAELAALTDPALITDGIARAMSLVASDQPTLNQLTEVMRDRHALIVLDNCEHLVDAVATLAIALLQACPRLSILTTSREALNVEGETTWRVPPMQPEEASRLFVERAQATRGELALGSGDPTVRHICDRLDGMPLAIELAAVRLQSLNLEDIAARLEDRFSLLSRGRRGAVPRHQTLQAMIDWSYDLLSEPEKIVFRRLGVFVGGWALEEANAMSGAGADTLALLTRLISKSLVLVDEADGPTRYRYLETIREYALAELSRVGELKVMRQRHAEVFMQLAEASVDWLHGSQQRDWLRRLKRDYPNLQAAMTWCLTSDGDALTGCRIAGALYHFWAIASNHASDRDKWAKIAKNALSEDMPSEVQAWVLLENCFLDDGMTGTYSEARVWKVHDLFMQAGELHHAALVKPIIGEAAYYSRGDSLLTLRLSEEGVEEARLLGVDWVLRRNLWMLGQGLRLSQKDRARAESVYRESAERSKAAGDIHEYAHIVGFFTSGYAKERLEFSESMRLAEEALALLTLTDDMNVANYMRLNIAENLHYLGRVPEATAILESCDEYAIEQHDVHAKTFAKVLRARIALTKGNLAQADALLTESLKLRCAESKPNAFLWGAYIIVDAMAVLAAAQNRAIRAARLRGVADSMYAINHHYRPANIEWEFAPYITKARTALGDEGYTTAYAEGCAMTAEQAIHYALNAADV